MPRSRYFKKSSPINWFHNKNFYWSILSNKKTTAGKNISKLSIMSYQEVDFLNIASNTNGKRIYKSNSSHTFIFFSNSKMALLFFYTQNPIYKYPHQDFQILRTFPISSNINSTETSFLLFVLISTKIFSHDFIIIELSRISTRDMKYSDCSVR